MDIQMGVAIGIQKREEKGFYKIRHIYAQFAFTKKKCI